MLNIKPDLNELVKSAIHSILKNKSRTFLTSLGVIIGVTSVILLISIGNGLKSYITDQFESLGSNTIYIIPGKILSNNGNLKPGEATGILNITFTEKDVQNLQRELSVAAVLPIAENTAKVKYLNVTKNVALLATTYNYGRYMNNEPAPGHGRWFGQDEENKNAKVVILGGQIKEDLFGRQNPIGKKISLGGNNFKVIGFLDKKGGIGLGGGNGIDNIIYLPITTNFLLTGRNDIRSIAIKTWTKEDISSVKKQAEKIMAKEYKKEDSFSVIDQAQILSSINAILGTITLTLSGIATISLIVGGIGIMNVMLITVSERTREIGLRKAIGAYPQAILIQFLIEAVILSILGGGVGIILGSVGAVIINNFLPAKVTSASIMLAFGVSSLVGIIFGVIPARQASRLSPIDALRYE